MENNDKLNQEKDEQNTGVTDAEGSAANGYGEETAPRRHRAGKAWLVLLIALGVIFGASFVPWSKLTGGKIKDFNLFSDILTTGQDSIDGDGDQEGIDPELLKAQKEQELHRQGLADASDTVIQPVKPSLENGMTIIEDYTSGNHGLSRFKAALESGRTARAAVVGDSYIEGDIMTQDLRAKLQTAYGGAGVGYMNMHSDFPGFRRSVKQGGNGWKSFNAIGKCNHDFMWLAEQYSKPSGSATSTYDGVTALPNLEKWNTSRFLFIAPTDTKISIKVAGEWQDHQVTGKPGVQCLQIDSVTSTFAVKTSDPGLVALGVWLENNTGVTLDCMSSRGFSGITLTQINKDLCRQMSQFVDYDLIILEFGINAMSSKQTNYSVYTDRMVAVINHVRECYPKADILLMGIGDRGERVGGDVHSMKTCVNMIDAQRDAARRAHCLFWNTRQAMGGDDAIVEWSRDGYANKDYIHMTHKGGDRLATLFFNALQHSLKK